jgi:hypothetical protein
MDGVREDLWREMLAERDRDAAAERLAAETSRIMAALLRHEEAEVPWEWAERALMIAGVIVSGWLARGGLWRLWRRLRGQPVTPAPAAPKLSAAVQTDESAPPPYAPERQAASAPSMGGVWM